MEKQCALYDGSSPPQKWTPFLSKYSILIGEVSFGDRDYYMHYQYLFPRMCVLCRRVSSLESIL